MGGPSVALNPSVDRRTVYGRVSRYKLDEYLQLFDFPSPSQSAEKRFATNVPLQRLFFMNSEFMQQQAEKLAVRVGSEPTDAARIRKAYRLAFGRVPTDAELGAGLEFLATEPMKQYEEKKAEAAKAKAKAAAAAAEGKSGPSAERADPQPAGGDEGGGDPGMMAGVKPGKAGGKEDAPKLPITVFGRYLKVLLSSNEFLFVS